MGGVHTEFYYGVRVALPDLQFLKSKKMKRIKVWLLTAIAGIILCQSDCIARSELSFERIGVTSGICVVLGEKSEIVVLRLTDGGVLWSKPLPSAPVPWGLAVDRDGRIVVTLEDGQVLCFG